MNTSELTRTLDTNNETQITIPHIYTTGKTKRKLNLHRLPTNYDPELATKCGVLLTATESRSLMNKIKKIPSVWSRDVILRYIHGDVQY